MGTISRHPVAQLIKHYNTFSFIETGTWKGDAIDFVKQFEFTQIFSVDISDQYFNSNKRKYKSDKRIKLFIGESGKTIVEMLDLVSNSNNILFWLDAHLPHAYGIPNLPEHVEVPLERELYAIISHRNIRSDIFIIDDLRLYKHIDHPQFENCPEEHIKGRNVNFIYDALSHTHTITEDYRDQGYIVAIPKHFS